MDRLRAFVHRMETPVITVVLTSAAINFGTSDASSALQHQKSVMWRVSPYVGIGSVVVIFYGAKFTLDCYFPGNTPGPPDPRPSSADPGQQVGANDSVQLVAASAEENDPELIGLITYVCHCAREKGDKYRELCDIVSRAQLPTTTNSPGAQCTGSSRAINGSRNNFHASSQLPDMTPQGSTSASLANVGGSSQAPIEISNPTQLPDMTQGSTSSPLANVGGSSQVPIEISISTLSPLGKEPPIAASSLAHLVLRIPRDIEDSLGDVKKLKKIFRSQDEASDSRLFYRRIELGPQIQESEIDSLRLQIIEAMELAQKIDKECTLQFGSFAVLQYTDAGPKWWKIPKHLTPTIDSIQRSPWSFSDLLPGRSAIWTIKGFNLQGATLRSTTAQKSVDMKLLCHYKARTNEDVMLCEEPQLVWNSAPLFRSKVYIYASRVVEIEMGVTIRLQSEVKTVKRPYWNSVVRGLISVGISGLPTIIMIAALSFWRETRSGDIFSEVAFAYLDNIWGLAMGWRPVNSTFFSVIYPKSNTRLSWLPPDTQQAKNWLPTRAMQASVTTPCIS
ncbi:unnamed protein product [Calypogeia fissa]